MSLPQSNQKIDLTLAIAQLRSHNLQALFQTLGWHPLNRTAITLEKQRCRLIAQRRGTVVWQVMLAANTPLTPILKRNLYKEIFELSTRGHSQADKTQANKTRADKTQADKTQTNEKQREKAIDPPVVIFIDAEQTRSLWCFAPQESALYVVGQPTELWTFRLKQLSHHRQTSPADPEASPDASGTGHKTFTQLLASLRDGIAGIVNPADKDQYAALTLQRLIFIQVMQTKGWLDQDRWYLQNRFGRSVQAGKNRFFADWLQPLYQSLALPEIERPLALVKRMGRLPFLENAFETHPLEEKYDAIAIDDAPFENILGWLSEQTHSDTLNPLASHQLGHWLSEHGEARSPQMPACQPSELAQAWGSANKICALSLDAFLEKKILQTARFATSTSQQFESAKLDVLLFNADSRLSRYLTQEILPELRILDPTCGSGLLLTAINRRLLEILAALTGYIQQDQDAQLKLWQSHLESEEIAADRAFADGISAGTVASEGHTAQEQISPKEHIAPKEQQKNLILNLQKRVVKDNLFGVDIKAHAAETTRFQLLLATLTLAKQPDELIPLPDLSFNIFVGNSLIGFIKVDEQRFDQVNRAGDLDIFQGNLLQPLAAEGYQTTLSEKNLALEHYKSRNQVLADTRSIPRYARASLLKEEIIQLDANAQNKLNALLLNYMSQQLGMQYKAMQLAEKPHRRLLRVEDIDILNPFHWGYQFSKTIERGGFDLVVCMPPQGAFKPSVAEFLYRFQDLTVNKTVDAASFKTSKQALSKADPDIAQAWMFYQDTYTCAADYFYRSEQYAHQNPTVNGKTARNQLIKERLFVERCFSLLKAEGLGAIALAEKLSNEERAQVLWHYLQASSDCSEHQVYPNESSGHPLGHPLGHGQETTHETENPVILSCYKRAST